MNRSLFDLTALPQLWLLQSAPAQTHFPAEREQREGAAFAAPEKGRGSPASTAEAAQAASEPEVEHT